jgi:hypothetical protein
MELAVTDVSIAMLSDEIRILEEKLYLMQQENECDGDCDKSSPLKNVINVK